MQRYVRVSRMIRIKDLKLNINSKEENLLVKIADVLMLQKIFKNNGLPDFSFEICRRSIDARKKPDIFYIYTVKVLLSDENEKLIRDFHRNKTFKYSDKILWDEPEIYKVPNCGENTITYRPVVVGSGPAGLFCALNFARCGFKPIVVERGECVENRDISVEKFWKGGPLNTESNIQFGEGGAGTFSDGKLNTLTKDKNGRNSYVLKTFYEFGAKREITFEAKPHIGTDVLKKVVKNMRLEIEKLGGTYMFNTKLIGINTEVFSGKEYVSSVCLENVITKERNIVNTGTVVLAIGHSSRDTLKMLYDLGVKMEQKNFAVGFRVVHPQGLVDRWAFDKSAKELGLPAADYKVTNQTSSGRNVYSFCMCPGGYVVNASSEEGLLCVNGMSYSGRDSDYANSAVIASVTPEDFLQKEVPNDHPLAGMYYQRNLEREAYNRGNGNICAQLFEDFVRDCKSEKINNFEGFVKGKAEPSNLRNIFSEEIDKAFIESMNKFGYTREYFDGKDVVMLGVETRTSSPVRILRNENCISNIEGLYPCGEGAGYAGGITSAAADGLRVSETIISKYKPGVF